MQNARNELRIVGISSYKQLKLTTGFFISLVPIFPLASLRFFILFYVFSLCLLFLVYFGLFLFLFMLWLVNGVDHVDE